VDALDVRTGEQVIVGLAVLNLFAHLSSDAGSQPGLVRVGARGDTTGIADGDDTWAPSRLQLREEVYAGDDRDGATVAEDPAGPWRPLRDEPWLADLVALREGDRRGVKHAVREAPKPEAAPAPALTVRLSTSPAESAALVTLKLR
jgi:hypothetical protein